VGVDAYCQLNLSKYRDLKFYNTKAIQTMIKLFYAPGTCALAPHIVLEWIGEPYDLQKVKQSDPEYLKLNPL
jgi:hypothetical protein